MVNFNFATAQRIMFGSGRFAELGRLTREFGRSACLVTGGTSLDASGRLGRLESLFTEAGVTWRRVSITHEPTVEDIDTAVAQAHAKQVDVVVAVGGGSVIDAGKAIAALLANGGETIDYLEGVGRGKTLKRPSIPFIAVPTTAGTGSEATKNAVIGNAAHTFKKSLRSDWMLPVAALVDPELTYDCPLPVAAACGMDALTQLLEAFTSRRANPLVDAIAGLGLGMAGRLPRLMTNPVDPTTRDALSMASLLGGIALANAGLGAVHGLASPLGAFYPIPHGVACAIMLPPVVARNARLAVEQNQRMLLDKYAAAAIQLIEMPRGAGTPEIPFDDPRNTDETIRQDPTLDVALSLASYLKSLVRFLGIPGLGSYGVTPADFPRIIADARAANSMKTNPVDLDEKDLEQVLAEAL